MAVAERQRVSYKDIQTELEVVRKDADGVLYPRDVVAYAENEETALHDCFEWDDTKAGHAHRIWQARRLIRAVVTVIPATNQTIEAYVSLKSDRQEEGGYRLMFDVLSDKQRRKQLLSDALADMELVERKYNQLQELAPVFDAVRQVREKI